jgi:hypothetical protein
MSQFKERLNQIAVRNLKVKHREYTTWPMEKKIEVVSQFLVLGNMKMVAAMTGVSYDLIRQWKTQPWWKELETEIRQTQNIEMDTKLSKIVDRSLDGVLDRIENGEFFYDQKTGEVKRKPANLRDVARVSVDMLSKRELLRGNATERKETSQISVGEQLKLLAMEFAKWQQKPASPVIDVEVIEVIEDAVYEERGHQGPPEESVSGVYEGSESTGLPEEGGGLDETSSDTGTTGPSIP